MKEMIKSKFMIGFVVFVVGFTYMNSTQMKGMMEDESNVEIMYNETK